MKLSRSARLRFGLELAGQWIADYGRAMLAVAGLLALAIVAMDYFFQGEAKPEAGMVAGFGTAAYYTGDEPLVTVRTKDGRLVQLPAPPAVRVCRIGDRILLIRRPHSLMVDPRGCRGAGG